jgi:hypothetical protein
MSLNQQVDLLVERLHRWLSPVEADTLCEVITEAAEWRAGLCPPYGMNPSVPSVGVGSWICDQSP